MRYASLAMCAICSEITYEWFQILLRSALTTVLLPACVTEWAVTTGLLTRSVADATLIPELKYARCLIDATCLPTQFSMRHVMTFTYVGRVCEGIQAGITVASC